MICDPLLKLLIIPLYHVIECIITDFAQSIYMVHQRANCRKGLVCFLVDLIGS